MSDPIARPTSASSPAGIPAPDDTPREIPRRSSLAIGALVLALLPFVPYLACATKTVDPEGEGAFLAWIGACILALWGAVLGIINLFRLRKLEDHEVRGRRMSLLAVVMGFLSPVATFILGFLTIDIHMNLGHGRALRWKKKQQVPPHITREDWLGDVPRLDGVPAAHDVARVAAAWRAAGATEAASVAAFSHVANELMALGAPSDLVEGAHMAALDEVRHARACYAFAAALDGGRLGPGPLPAANGVDGAKDLTALARNTAFESVLLEGASARVARTLAARADVEQSARAVLAGLADDELAHAAHGLAIVRWCIERGGEKARAAARQALVDVNLDRVLPDCPADLERWGVASVATWRECLEEARRAALVELERA